MVKAFVYGLSGRQPLPSMVEIKMSRWGGRFIKSFMADDRWSPLRRMEKIKISRCGEELIKSFIADDQWSPLQIWVEILLTSMSVFQLPAYPVGVGSHRRPVLKINNFSRCQRVTSAPISLPQRGRCHELASDGGGEQIKQNEIL